MTRIVLLLVALLMIGVAEPVDAARPTRYARAKMRGKTYTHRPFYKRYKGRKTSKKRFSLLRQKSRSQSTYKVGRHSTR
ncbi:hypothetical protein MUN84_01605 [Hymenobacter sp. 5516J-16]|uniref:Uncharacterized protein n=1 Tax=Hymenobacter sublimis TaxID=2933777 RepID=A0ABY4JE41_9BACT|nr:MULTISPECIES: hypothetical protein [Hymenobacter]UOQ77438.1 hypothetical protein MUN84_01605 [Hymenobacter sp. 5516J-16]UPL51113.1 hypothetical protein MWH26_09440 [Hymenobacter sublimis]